MTLDSLYALHPEVRPEEVVYVLYLPSLDRYYTGWSQNFSARLRCHQQGRGAAITRAAAANGDQLQVVVKFWGADRATEREWKNRRNTPLLLRREGLAVTPPVRGVAAWVNEKLGALAYRPARGGWYDAFEASRHTDSMLDLIAWTLETGRTEWGPVSPAFVRRAMAKAEELRLKSTCHATEV